MDAEERMKREAIIAACLEMNRSGLNQGTSGNISVRHGDGLLITPTAIAYEKLAPEDIVFLAMDGTATGRHRPSSEWRFHRDILASRPDAHAVVHAHPLACTTLAIMNREIPAVHYMIAAAGGPTIRVAPYAIYGSEDLSRNAVAALEGRLACLLEHHGMIAIGPSLPRTMWTAVEVETLAKQYLGCLQLGEVRLLSDAQIAAVVERFAGYGLQV
ncbi:class II aldolase/adducin family protein [Rhodobacter sp. NSM]|uniref:class II aldolase/adducin family protein n=1 Tax=Rhodobacter sp. NSM TaxID=3457501 RepID=UPI003FD4B213